MPARILIVGETEAHSLEMTYCKAFRSLGHEVRLFDTRKAVKKYARFGNMGYQLHRFFPVEAWLRKANKELAETANGFNPEILLVFTGAEILAGALAYTKSILPQCSIVLYWADPMTNLSRYFREGLPLADLVASYSQALAPVFIKLGAGKVQWIPFAGDPDLHYAEAADIDNFQYDIAFVGSWRPERERSIRNVYEVFPTLRYKISGPYWERCKFAPIRKIANNRPLYGKEFTNIVQQTFLNLNIMDIGNYPAVNMRFFEIFTAGGAQLCTDSPEMKTVFLPGQHVLYFTTDEELISQVQFALDHPSAIHQMKKDAQILLLNKHTYRQRAADLLAALQEIT